MPADDPGAPPTHEAEQGQTGEDPSVEDEPSHAVTATADADVRDSEHDVGHFGQLVLVREPAGEPLPVGLTAAEQIEMIMARKEIELVLLDGPPRLEGVCWDPKKAARADEIIAFIMLNGPSTLRQVALALWPDHPRPDKTASQQISRARHLLGDDADGQPRLRLGNRATPYVIHDVGCDWNRFVQLSELADTRKDEHERLTLLRAALSLVRSAPFESARSKSFTWAADQCFDSRMRLEITASVQNSRTSTATTPSCSPPTNDCLRLGSSQHDRSQTATSNLDGTSHAQPRRCLPANGNYAHAVEVPADAWPLFISGLNARTACVLSEPRQM